MSEYSIPRSKGFNWKAVAECIQSRALAEPDPLITDQGSDIRESGIEMLTDLTAEGAGSCGFQSSVKRDETRARRAPSPPRAPPAPPTGSAVHYAAAHAARQSHSIAAILPSR